MDEYWAKIKDNITCSLCYELFNHSNRLPKGLPCYHSFCLHCLTSYVSKSLEEGYDLLCPLCKKKFTILVNESVNDLPTNPSIMNNVDIFSGNKEEANIPVCEAHGNKQYSFLCSVCNTGLCNFCITNLKDGPHANHALEDYCTAFEELGKKINKSENVIKEHAIKLNDVHSVLKDEVHQASQKEIESVIEREQEVIAKAKEWRKRKIEDIGSEKEAQLLDITSKYDLLNEKLDKTSADLKRSKSLLESNDCNAFAAYKELEDCTLSNINDQIVVKLEKNTQRKNLVSLPTVENIGMLVPHNQFSWYISDVNKFINATEYQYSPPFFYLNQEWKILSKIGNNYVEIYIENSTIKNDSTVKNEQLSVKLDYDLIVIGKIKSDVSHNLKHTFSKEEPEWGFDDFMKREDFLEPTNGYVYDNCAAFSVNIHRAQRL